MSDGKPRDDELFGSPEQPSREQRFSLLCEGHIIRLDTGTFTLGRSSDCDIVVDDMLASRRHARLHVSSTRLLLEDLGSTNGCYVNGERVHDKIELHAGDVLLIGTQQLHIGALPVDPDITPSYVLPPIAELDEPDSSVLRFPVGDKQLDDGPPADDSGAVWRSQVTDRPASSRQQDGTERADAFQTLAPVIERWLDDGRVEDVQKLMRRQVDIVIEGLQRGEAMDAESLERASLLLVRLAGVTLDVLWVEKLLELHLLLQRPFSGPLIVELTPILPGLRSIDSTMLDDYVSMLRSKRDEFPLADRVSCDRTLSLLLD